jgi:hypothetical protein
VKGIALAAATMLMVACVAPVELKVGDWTASCVGVATADCQGIASLFINNLASSGASVLRDSGGRISIVQRPDCPAVPAYNDGRVCWQASASVPSGRVCMVVARQNEGPFGFGQVGGDDMAGRAGPPPDGWPTCR